MMHDKGDKKDVHGPTQGGDLYDRISGEFHRLAAKARRRGIIGAVPVDGVDLLPQQRSYLTRMIAGLGDGVGVSAVVVGLYFHDDEVLAIPERWTDEPQDRALWNRYAHAYTQLNRELNRMSVAIAALTGGVAEQATIEGWSGTADHVDDYFPHCASHRAFAEAAGLGWKGRHRLIVTPEAGPALRFAMIFVRGALRSEKRPLSSCGDCSACLKVCPHLRKGEGYRELCRRRIAALGLDDEVCGLCVRACWEAVKRSASITGVQRGEP